MARVNNADVIKSLIDKAKINTSTDRTPDQLAEKIIPVLDTAPERVIQLASANKSDSAAAEHILSTSSTKKTYLVSVTLSVTKDAVSDAVFTNVSAKPKGQTEINVMLLRYEPTTAGQFIHTVHFPIPILLEKSSNVSMTHSSATASIDGTGSIQYYEVED